MHGEKQGFARDIIRGQESDQPDLQRLYSPVKHTEATRTQMTAQLDSAGKKLADQQLKLTRWMGVAHELDFLSAGDFQPQHKQGSGLRIGFLLTPDPPPPEHLKP